jgi:cleavage and polyadenylation specificity factor subunit 1
MVCGQPKRDKFSPRQLNHLDFVAQFTTDIGPICGQDNVAEALSRFESVTAPPSYEALAASQDSDDELRTLLGSTTDLRLKKLIPGTTVSIYCDVCPYGSNCSSQSMIYRTRAPKQRQSLSRSVLFGQACRRIATPGHQRSKVSHHTVTPLGNFTPPAVRFLHVHIDLIGPLPTSAGYTYCHTAVDRFTRWPEVFPYPRHHSRHRGTCPTERLDIPLRLLAGHHHRPGTSI